jgi:hypothetical protein
MFAHNYMVNCMNRKCIYLDPQVEVWDTAFFYKIRICCSSVFLFNNKKEVWLLLTVVPQVQVANSKRCDMNEKRMNDLQQSGYNKIMDFGTPPDLITLQS